MLHLSTPACGLHGAAHVCLGRRTLDGERAPHLGTCSPRHRQLQVAAHAAPARRPKSSKATEAQQQAGLFEAAGPDSLAERLASAIAPMLACAAFAAQVLWTGPWDVALARHTPLTPEESNVVQLFKTSTPAVVYITNLASRQDQFTLDMLEMPQGAGSGTIWDKAGHIVTNYHVVKDASELSVSLTGGLSQYGGDGIRAKVVGVDADKDIAVLKIDVPADQSLHPLRLGDSADLLVGQKVYAIGNPFGLDHTLTTGVISGLEREISSGINGRPIQGVIQSDAAINPGNSGGPLLDSAGELIGINTAIYSPSGANAGVGFAVPIDILRSSVSQIIEYGKVIRPIMGIAFAPEQTIEQGILVLDARKDGPAFKAGVKGTSRDANGRLILGDIIVKMNDRVIRSASDLYRGLDGLKVGDTVDLEVLRQNSREHVNVVLEASA